MRDIVKSKQKMEASMKVELKNVKICKWASEETLCFNASIYLNGKKVGTVENSGHGGCNFYHFDDRDIEQKFYDYCKSLPPIEFNGEPLEMDADLYISELLENYEYAKKVRQYSKKNILFRLLDDEKYSFRTINTRNELGAIGYLNKKYGKENYQLVK